MDQKRLTRIIFGVILLLSVGVALGVAGYLMKNRPSVIAQPLVSSAPEPSPSPIVKDETSNWKTYRNEEYGFEFKYPLELKGGESNEIAGERYQQRTLFLGAYGHSSVNFSVEIVPINDFTFIHPDFSKTMSSHKEIINGIEMTEYADGGNRFVYIPLQKSNYNQIEIFAEILNDATDKNFDQIISTFKFIENNLPSDLSDIIYEAARNDYRGMDSCGEKEVTINDYQYNFETADLNNDGSKEFIIEPIGFCNSVDFRGAQGNGPYYIFEKINGVWKNISSNVEGNNLEVLERKTDEYSDILTTWHMGAGALGLMYYKWQKQEITYKEVSSKDIEYNENFDIDKEINNFIESQK